MGTTPTLALPYPEVTDRVSEGAQAIEDLALAVEDVITDQTTWQAWNPVYSSDTAMGITNVTGSHPTGDQCRYRIEGKTCYVAHARILNKTAPLGNIIKLSLPPGVVPKVGRANMAGEADNTIARVGLFDSFTEIGVRKAPHWNTGSEVYEAGAHWVVFDGFFELA